MSHFITAVFHRPGESVEPLLAPYNEQDESYFEFCPCGYDPDDLRREYESVRDKYHYASFYDFMKRYHGCVRNQRGEWGWRCNPNAKWDWYQEGGRWSGFFHTGDGADVSEELVSRIDFTSQDSLPWAFVTADGEWFEKGQVGWFGMSDDTPASRDAFSETFRRYVREHPGLMVTAVDCHI